MTQAHGNSGVFPGVVSISALLHIGVIALVTITSVSTVAHPSHTEPSHIEIPISLEGGFETPAKGQQDGEDGKASARTKSREARKSGHTGATTPVPESPPDPASPTTTSAPSHPSPAAS